MTKITVNVTGAQGGAAYLSDWSDETGRSMSLGGWVQAEVSVIPGDTLYIFVGGQGLVRNESFGGGGAGGFDIFGYARGGGGASDIRTNLTDLSSRIVVAGGGGGGGSAGHQGWGKSYPGHGGMSSSSLLKFTMPYNSNHNCKQHLILFHD